jgi:hypothetical protein
VDDGRDDGRADLLREASLGELLAMGARSLVRTGVDRATAHVCLSPGLVLVGQVGFPPPFVQHFSVVRDGTAWSHAVATGAVVRVDDVADDPIYDGTDHQRVMIEAGSLACTASPVRLDDRIVGAVSAHYGEPGPHDPAPVEQVVAALEQLLPRALHIEPDLPATAVVEATELRAALESRNLIGMAKGILMATMGVSDEEAFAVLVRVSQRENVKLRDICARIVARHQPPNRPPNQPAGPAQPADRERGRPHRDGGAALDVED